MNDAQLRGLVGLSVVLLILVGLLQYWEPADESADPLATEEVWSLDADQVAKIVVERPDSTLEITRGAEGWRIVAPIDWPADAFQVEALLDELARIERGQPLPSVKPEDVELGAKPRARVKLEDKAGVVRSLDFGIDAPVGFRTYARAGEGPVLAVEGHPGRKLTESVEAFRDRRMLHFDSSKLQQIVLTSREGTLDARRVGDAWWLEGYARIDLNQLDDFMHDLRNLRFDELIDADATGLLEPRYVLELVEEGGERQVLQFGDDTPMGTVVHKLGVAAGMANTRALRPLGRGPQDLGAKHAFAIEPAGLTAVDLDLDGAKGTLTKGEGQAWTSAGLAAPGADAFLSRVGEASIHYRRDAPAEPSESYGTITFHLKSGPRRYLIGEREGAQWRVVREEGGGSPYLVAVGEIEAIRDAWAGLTTTSGG